MNKINAENLFSQMITLFMRKKGDNFENFFQEDIICTLNSTNLNLEQIRLAILSLVENFQIENVIIDNFLYEDEKAITHCHFQIKNIKTSEQLVDDLFFVIHFKDGQIKACWLLSSLFSNKGQSHDK